MGVLEVSIREISTDAVCVTAVGTIDGTTVKIFQEALDNVRRDRKFKLIIDASFLKYMSSAGIGVLLEILALVIENSGKLVLSGVVKDIRDVLEELGIGSMFSFADDMPSALRMLGEGTSPDAQSSAPSSKPNP